MLWIKKGIDLWDPDRRTHRNELQNIAGDAIRAWQFEHMYRCLDALDTKTGALMQFNSVILAVWAIFVSAHIQLGDASKFTAEQLWPLHAVLLLSVVSMYFVKKAIWVHWSTSEELGNPDAHILELIRVRDRRTVHYRRANILATWSVASLVTFFAAYGLPKLPFANAFPLSWLLSIAIPVEIGAQQLKVGIFGLLTMFLATSAIFVCWIWDWLALVFTKPRSKKPAA